MPSDTDIREVDVSTGTEQKRRRRFDARDWAYVSDYVIEEFDRRSRLRSEREQQWSEIDRQVAMTPSTRHKLDADGNVDVRRAWMSEMELPLQAQTLELTTAEVRQMLFPQQGSWFWGSPCVDGDFLGKVEEANISVNKALDEPFLITQDNVAAYTMSFVQHQFNQYPLRDHYDAINAEATKYGVGVGRFRTVDKRAFIHTARGTMRETQQLPVLFPVSIKDTYLEPDAEMKMSEGMLVSQSVVFHRHTKLEDLIIAANRGSPSPRLPNGGWMAKSVSNLAADDNGLVELLEYEGDLVVPRQSTRSMFVPGVIVTVARGGRAHGSVTTAVVRMRFRQDAHSSYLLHPYHVEDVGSSYATSPLMKGRVVQIAAVDALNRIMDSSALRNAPPVSYDRTDSHFMADGGPRVAPFELWASSSPVTAHTNIGGDVSSMAGLFQVLVGLYADVTGVNAARLGSQTVSHTTAFAKNAELQKGAIRVVDYVASIGYGPLTSLVDRTYRAARRLLNSPEKIYVEPYDGWVELTRNELPEQIHWQWFGSGGPQAQQAALDRRTQALLMAMQIDQTAIQLGNQPEIDRRAAMEAILREGGWTDVDVILGQQGAARELAADPGVAQLAQANRGPATAAIQALGAAAAE